MPKRIIVLGVGSYSEHLLRALGQLGGVETVAVDKDEERINAVADYVDVPTIGNANRYELLERMDVQEADQVIVALGDLAESLVCILFLRDLKCPRIVARALNEEHARILGILGVDEIVFPEKIMAERGAYRLIHPHVGHVRALNDDESIIEIEAPRGLVGKTLEKIGFEDGYGLQVLVIIHGSGALSLAPDSGTTIAESDSLLLAGKNESLRKLTEAFEKKAKRA